METRRITQQEMQEVFATMKQYAAPHTGRISEDIYLDDYTLTIEGNASRDYKWDGNSLDPASSQIELAHDICVEYKLTDADNVEYWLDAQQEEEINKYLEAI